MAPSDRPAVWVGHAGPLVVPDLDAAVEFYSTVGLHLIWRDDDGAALQLRGGTHLVLRRGEPVGGEAPFDLMADDVAEVAERVRAAGFRATDPERTGNHERVVLTDPSGTTIRVHDSHVVGPA